MTVLVTGSTGTIGSQILPRLAHQGIAVHALSRDIGKARFPEGVVPVAGDLLDVESMRKALQGVSTLFLLNAVAPQELTQALLTLNLARDAGIQRLVYFSVFNADAFSEVPHFAAKCAVEKAIARLGIPATILRPNCFMQNDAAYFRDALLGPGLYPFPIGEKGVSMIDVRDIAEIAAGAVLQRERSAHPLPSETIALVGPHALSGPGIAKIWSELLGKPIRYTGSDTRSFEAQLAHHAPGWMAMDMRLMLDGFVTEGMAASASDVDTITRLLGRSARSYAEFASETLSQWRA